MLEDRPRPETRQDLAGQAPRAETGLKNDRGSLHHATSGIERNVRDENPTSALGTKTDDS